MPGKKKAGTRKPDIGTIAGLIVAIGGILAGLLLEGGKVQDVAQVTAGLIVLGGTLGAVLVTTPLSVALRAAGRLRSLFIDSAGAPSEVLDEIVAYATKARKQGIVSLEKDTETIEDPFLKKALILAVDGTDIQQIRNIMETEIRAMEHRDEEEAKVYEAAGGYSPTIGIIGAVLGLIQVMKNLANIDEVGRGIAVAFVATVYGVGLANIFLLPAAGKLKGRAQARAQHREMVLEGVIAIVEGLNPKLIRTKLEVFATDTGDAKKQTKPGKAPARAAAAEA